MPSFVTNLVVIVSVAGIAVPSGAEPAIPPRQNPFPNGPYCGVYCLHRAVHSLGYPVDIDALLDPKYIGSVRGSSLAELAQAAKDSGAAAVPVRGLTADALQSARRPILLHVAGSALTNSYNHWVLFLGMEDGYARIYDPPGRVSNLPMARLMSISDGLGLIVQPADEMGLGLSGWTWRTIGIILFGLALVIAHRTIAIEKPVQTRQWGFVRRCLTLSRNAALLFLAGAALGLLHDVTNADGLLRNTAAVAGLTHKFFPDELPETSIAELRAHVAGGQTMVVDARQERGYAAGHIPGAVNVPVTCGLFGHRELLVDRQKSTPVVVYCQNDHCMWARDVALRLLADGYENVSVFPGGWTAWQAAEVGHEQ